MGAHAFPAASEETRVRLAMGRAATLVACVGLWWAPSAVADSLYRWVDAEGVTHISSTRPAGDAKAERIEVGRTSSAPRHSAAASATGARATGAAAKVTAQQAAEREALLAHLRERECVYALESLDRIASGKKPANPAERQRVQQTVDLNCSRQPQRRGEQQALAAKLRVANGSVCLDARNELAAMLEPGRRPQRLQLQTQQEFIEAHCTAPVR
jgi:hypothetical protein